MRHEHLYTSFVAREAEIWAIEERQLQERQQLYKQQLKDLFYLQRTQMLERHKRVCSFILLFQLFLQEMEMTRKSASKQEMDAQRSLADERKRLPKTLRSESKTRSMMFKESLRINHVDDSDIEVKIRQFDEKV